MDSQMGLRQKEAPLCEPITLEQAKVFLRIDHTEDDHLIRRLIKTARQSIESFTGRALIRQCWTFSLNAGFAYANSDVRYLSRNQSRGERGIELPKSPFLELVGPPRMVDNYGERDIQDYRLDTAGRVAHMHLGSSAGKFLQGRGELFVHFWAGYGEEAEDVPEPLRQGILMALVSLYDGRAAANDLGFMPKPLDEGVIQLIKPYRAQRAL
tara:strand:- start:619 stop:1251 length:633 start_codon:yes stop_codon:yes gene_type:complete